MKKIMALVLAAMMLLGCCSCSGRGARRLSGDHRRPGLRRRHRLHLDYWSGNDDDAQYPDAEPDEDTQKLYDYRDWLEETYNCKIVETALSDWAGNPTELANMVMNGDNSKLCLVAVAADFAGTPLANDLYMPWTIDLSGEKWNKADNDFMTKDGKVYGVHVGKTEPRSCIFFNKRVLSEAGIDPESIYDAQADGTWTWDMMLNIMEQVQRDVDNDGINDIYGMTGSGDDLAIAWCSATTLPSLITTRKASWPSPPTARPLWTPCRCARPCGKTTVLRSPKAPTGTGSKISGSRAPPPSMPARPGRASTTALKWPTWKTSGAA